LVNAFGNREQLPNLTALECDFEDPLIGFVRQTFHLLVEDFNTPRLNRHDEVRAFFNPLLAFFTKHHRRESLER